MMLNAEIAHRSEAPPANVLYKPSMPPVPCDLVKLDARTFPSMPGSRTYPSTWATASNPNVNKIRDFSSGILKQLTKVLMKLRNMNQITRNQTLAGATALRPTTSTVPPLASILALAEALNALALTVSFLESSPVPRILIPSPGPFA